MKYINLKRIISMFIAVAVFIGGFGVICPATNLTVKAATNMQYSSYSYWSGSAASEFTSGVGTKNDPYIITTADQLYKMVKSNGMLAGGSVAYYKVADGVTAFYLNDADTLEEVKALVSAKKYKNWAATEKFCGVFDGNGVTVYGMVSYNANSFVYALDGSYATIKNINFDSCYVYSTGNAAVVTTRVGSYKDEVLDTPFIANVSVRNVYVQTTRNISVSADGSHSPSTGGIVSTADTPKLLTITNCFFDGYSSQLVQGSNSNVDATAGVFAGASFSNNTTINSSVSLGANLVPQAEGAVYTRYDINNNSGFQFFVYSSYTDKPETVKETATQTIESKDQYELLDLPELDWCSNWQLVTTSDGRTIPMPRNNSRVSVDASTPYGSQIAAQNNGGGARSVFGGAYSLGTYGMYHSLLGSGTKQDPYLIHNGFELARAIASGGMNVYNRLYYRLVSDIDVSNAKWITQDAIHRGNDVLYNYTPFNGELDGDGHTVTGMYAGDDQSVGLIPVLAEQGVVKNLHVRNSCIVSSGEYAGAIVGEAKLGAQITGCSVEGCTVLSSTDNKHIVGKVRGTVVTNSYYIADEMSSVQRKTSYYSETGSITTINVAKNQDVWYMGGRDGSTPKLKNFAKAQILTDVDGDGDASEYTVRDLAALRQMLLFEKAYQNIYGDVDRNGKTDILDLVILCNEMTGDYSNPNNNFWRNVKCGKVSIYYGENDSYDAARKLELYLESAIPGIDIKKIVSADKTVSGTNSDSSAVYVHTNDLIGKPTGEVEIIVGDIKNHSIYSQNTLNVNDYAIDYDTEKGVLWFKGGSFTGVEQAVIDFINNSTVETGEIYTVENATLSQEKWAKTVLVDTDYDGNADTEKTLYYAWGDEFDGIKEVADGENGEISIDTWNHSKMRTETEMGKTGNYNNIETVNEKELSNLYWVENGKLCVTRGVKAEHATEETDKLNYVRLNEQTGTTLFNDSIDSDDVIANPGLIKTNHSFLYKQGYAEMYGSLPSDGHTFASWWMLGHGSMNNFAIMESLYSKVYKLNNTGEYAYDGITSWPISTNPKTYRYQVPTNYFEIDIWELMQNNGIAHKNVQQSKLTGFYDYRLYLNVHKFYSVGTKDATVVNVIDWDNPDTPRAVIQKDSFGSKEFYFSTSAAYHDFTDGTNTRFTKDWLGRVSANYVETLQKQLTAPRRYGFYWNTNGVDKFNFTLYIYDINGDGVEDDNAILGTSDMTYNKDSGKDPQNYDIVNDAEVANQYMYFLLDNVLYSSNPNHSSSTSDNAAMHTDMLTNDGTQENPDKIDLEIDYLRVYQYDGRRDIVTNMTEDFNNGNHFGY